MKLIYLKSALKCDSFDVTIGINIPFFRISVTIEPGRSLLKFVTTNCLKAESCVIIILLEIENRFPKIFLEWFFIQRKNKKIVAYSRVMYLTWRWKRSYRGGGEGSKMLNYHGYYKNRSFPMNLGMTMELG